MENLKKEGTRKNGCLINEGNKLKRDKLGEMKERNVKLYGVPESVYKNIALPLPQSIKTSSGGFQEVCMYI